MKIIFWKELFFISRPWRIPQSRFRSPTRGVCMPWNCSKIRRRNQQMKRFISTAGILSWETIPPISCNYITLKPLLRPLDISIEEAASCAIQAPCPPSTGRSICLNGHPSRTCPGHPTAPPSPPSALLRPRDDRRGGPQRRRFRA